MSIVRVLAGGLIFGLGTTAGVAFSMTTDPTEYSQADLDRAASTESVVGALDPDDRAQLEELQAAAAEAAPQLRTAQTRVEELTNEVLARETELARSEPTLTRLRQQVRRLRAEAASARGVAEQEAAAAESEALGVSGTVRVTYALGADLKPWPEDCSDAVPRYRVRVEQGDGTPVTVAEISGASVLDRTAKQGVLGMTCALTWSAELPAPRADRYALQVVAAAAPETPLSATTVSAESLAAGVAPEIAVSR